jgi:hypothetical protein
VFDMVKICVGLIVIQYWDFASDGGGIYGDLIDVGGGRNKR